MDINDQYLKIRNAYKNNKTNECLDLLEEMAEEFGDEQLKDDVLDLYSKYNTVNTHKEDQKDRKEEELAIKRDVWDIAKTINKRHINNQPKEEKSEEKFKYAQNRNEKPQTFSASSSLLNIKSSELSSEITSDEFKNILNLRDKYLEEVLLNIGGKIDEDPRLRDLFSDRIFDVILSKEKLSTANLNDIRKIRGDINEEKIGGEKIYSSDKRALVVAALSLTFGRSKKLDAQRLGLLLDFLADKEDKVWQRALVGLFLGLHRYHHRISNYMHITSRLKSLQQDEEVQEGLMLIDTILRKKSHLTLENIGEKIASNKFLEKPQNWFMLFFRDNTTLRETIETVDIDGEKLMNFLNLPIIDSTKYLLCLKLQEESENDKNEKSLKNIILEANIPPVEELTAIGRKIFSDTIFFNNISEFYLFYKFFPRHELQNIFQKQVSLNNTKLEDILLNEKRKFKMKAMAFMENKKHGKALKYFQKLQNIEGGTGVDINLYIGECLLNEKKYSKAIISFNKALELKPENKQLLLRIGECYHELEEFERALEFLKPVKEKESFNQKLWGILGETYMSLKKYDEAYSLFKEIYDKGIHDFQVLLNLGAIYANREKYRKALACLDKITLKICNQRKELMSIIMSNKAALYQEIANQTEDNNTKKIQEYLDIAFKMDSKNDHAYFIQGYILHDNGDYKNAVNNFDKGFKFNKSEKWDGYIDGYSIIQANKENGDFTKALKYFSKIEKQRKLTIDEYVLKSEIVFEQGQILKAKSIIEEAISLYDEGECSILYFSLAEINVEENDKDTFYQNFDKCLSLENKYTKEILMDIKEFQSYLKEPRFIAIIDKYFPE